MKLPHALHFIQQFLWRNVCGCIFQANAATNYRWSGKFNYTLLLQVALLLQRCRAMLRVCIASIQTVERILLLLVVTVSDKPLRTIKFFSVLFSSVYSSMLQAVINKHSLVRRRLCDLHCRVVGNCFCHFVVRTSSNRSIASGSWLTAPYTQLHRR